MFDNDYTKETADEFDPDSFDNYLHVKLAIDRGSDRPEFAKVNKRLKDHRGNPIGTRNNNPMLDTLMHEVECHDGSKQALVANVIAGKKILMFTKKVIDVYY